MDYNKSEDANSPSGDTPEESTQETPEETSKDAPKEDKELEEKNRQLFERAKKAETEAKDLKSKLKDLSEESKEPEPKPQSDEPDYARLGFLNSKSITHPDDQKAVLDEAERLKLPITDVLEMEHIKSKLQASQETRVAKEGMPEGKGRTGQESKGDVEYYADKPDELPEDLELANKVIDARLNKIENEGKFSKTLYTG